MYSTCNSVEWSPIEVSGQALACNVRTEERTRIVTNIEGTAPEEVSIGLPAEVIFEHFDDCLMQLQFTPWATR
jgi:hypothetical protein